LFKKRILTIYHWRLKKFKTKFPPKKKVLNFSKFFKSVFDKITLELELKSRKFRKKEILIPIPVSPWKGTRMGLSLLLKNSQTRIDKKKKHRKHKFLYNLLDEMWDTQNQTSLTSKNVVEFTENVLEHAENFRSTRLFPVKKSRQIVYPSKLIDDLENQKVETKKPGRVSSAVFFKEKKKKQVEYIKKMVDKFDILEEGETYVQYKKKMFRVNLAKLAQAKLLLEEAKKRRAILKNKNRNKTRKKSKNRNLDFFLYSVFVKAKKKRKLKFFTLKNLIFSTLRKQKKLIVNHYIKKKFVKRIRVFYKKKEKGIDLNNYFFRNERLLGLKSNKQKKINLMNKKIERVFINNTRKKKNNNVVKA
jgi:hypothetical protein